jgi:hypothetical protein
LSSTGISRISPRTADDGLVGTEVVQQRDDLLPEGRHRVLLGVHGPVGAAVAEEVDGDDVEAGAGDLAGERLLHAAWHQLAVDEHDPLLARPVLGVLHPVVVDEELPDPLRHQRGHGFRPLV